MMVSAPIFLALVLIVPMWRIFDRAGLNPYLSLILFVPFFGLVIVLLMLAFTRWPNTEAGLPLPPPASDS
jgi:amino acid permease